MISEKENIARYLIQLSEGESEIILEKAIKPGAKQDPATAAKFRELRERAAACTLCRLSETRKNVVFGDGNPQARLMFIGEAPGADEDIQGLPFVGRAGQLLNKILAAMELSRENVYIANILKCRPPGNRNPEPGEAKSCIPYLKEQIELINPDVLVALGLVAAVHLLGLSPTASVKSLRGRIFDYNGKPMIVTYHPAALLRSPAYKAPTWEDMQTVMKLLSGEIVWEAEIKTGLGI